MQFNFLWVIKFSWDLYSNKKKIKRKNFRCANYQLLMICPIQVALDYSWEQLHTGYWQNVKLFWRKSYSLAALLKALNLTLQGKWEYALVEVDKGLLLGAPILNNSLHTIASIISEELRSFNEESSVSKATVCGLTTKEDGNYQNTVDNRPKRIGKVKFRSYLPSSLDIDKREKKSITSKTPSLTCYHSDVPLVDMERRIPVINSPSLSTFYLHHMIPSVTVVISGGMDHWPAYAERKWR